MIHARQHSFSGERERTWQPACCTAQPGALQHEQAGDKPAGGYETDDQPDFCRHQFGSEWKCQERQSKQDQQAGQAIHNYSSGNQRRISLLGKFDYAYNISAKTRGQKTIEKGTDKVKIDQSP